MAKKATMMDVARLAQVSVSTVSHVINKTAPISEATAERVRAAIEQLHYSPNLLARSLRHEKSHLIGVAMTDITSEFYAGCIEGILEEARKQNYNILICGSMGHSEFLESSVQSLLDNQVDGFIFLGGSGDETAVKRIANANVPMVFADRHVPNFPSVEFDNEETYCRLVHALYESGYRRFMYLGESLDIQTNLLDRYNGYVRGLKECNMSNKMDMFRRTLFNRKMSQSYMMFDEILESFEEKKNKPDVIVTSNDMIAHGLISAATKKGICVPEELAVVGCDDVNFSACYSPTLTTIHQDAETFGKSVYKLLKRCINEEKIDQNTRVVLPQSIVVRESAVIRPEVLEKWRDKK